jgi:DNA polymerase I-like protein with 3'-5' exonuclease and polymerase domains
MKLKIEYDPDNYEDKQALEPILKASDYKSAFQDIRKELRNMEKHGFFMNKEMNADQMKIVLYLLNYVDELAASDKLEIW